jgi:hypothetical protein
VAYLLVYNYKYMLQFHGPFSPSRAAVIEVNPIMPMRVILKFSRLRFLLLPHGGHFRERKGYATSEPLRAGIGSSPHGQYGIHGAVEVRCCAELQSLGANEECGSKSMLIGWIDLENDPPIHLMILKILMIRIIPMILMIWK